MPNGKPKPLSLVNGHRTKKEIEIRKQAEQALYTGIRFKESPEVKADTIAHKEFLRLKKLYAQITFIDGLDQGIINRYCLEIASQSRMQQMMTSLSEMAGQTTEFEAKLEVFSQLNKMLVAAHKSKELLIKYEDRLFLSPAGRIKAIPKTPVKKEEESSITKFRQKRADSN